VNSGQQQAVRVGIVGCGAIGSAIARAVDAAQVPGAALAAVCDSQPERATALAESLASHPAACDLAGLIEACDIVVEAASAAALPEIARPALEAGRTVLAMSVGALLGSPDLMALARERGARLLAPSGAIAGLDAVKAAAAAGVESVTLTTRKPPAGLAGAPYLVAHGVDLSKIAEATTVFEGPAAEAVKGFPANVNVAAALSLAGIGPERTRVRIVADPAATANSHEIEVRGEFGCLTARTENRPSPDNPKTSYLAALSAIAALRDAVGQTRIGT
jgi:aspartate dehydrogenase